jgi:RHS repeat-associated protein
MDLSVAGSVGNFPLEFKRTSATRLSGRNLSHSAFGIESSWSHNYEWVMRDNGGTITQPIVKITYPDGSEYRFQRPDATSTVWPSTSKGVVDRLYVSGDDFALRTGDLANYHFKRRIHSVTGGIFYRIESIKDPSSNIYTISYLDNDDTLIRQVTDAAGHFIKLHYQDIALRSNASTVLAEQLLPAGSTGVWKEVTVTPGQSFRFLALYQGNSWRQKMALRVAELEFYDQNNVKISGTPFGSWPNTGSNTPSKAFDTFNGTYYEYQYEKAGYVGLDLGAGNAKQVSRIRYRLPTYALNTDASVTFVGMNNDLVPNYVISHIESSDGRQIGYDYTTYTEPSGIFQWAQLNAAHYPDLTSSQYTYKWQHRHTMPVIDTLDEPRSQSAVPRVRYAYDMNAAIGFVVDQYEKTSNQPLTGVRWDGGHIPKLVTPNGRVNRFEFSDGLLTRAIDSYGATSDFTYNTNGFLTAINDPLGRNTTIQRGTFGRISSVTTPGGSTTTYTRDGVGYVTAVNVNGKVTGHILDATTKRRTRTNHPDATYETWTYNTYGQVLTHRQRNGFSESWTYDAAGLLRTHTDAVGAVTTWHYYGDSTYPATNDNNIAVNIIGRIAAIVDPHGNTTAFHYNDRGQITRQTETPGGNINLGAYPVQNTTNDFITITLNTYDDYGNLLVRIINTNDPAAPSRRWIYEYDSLRRRTREQDPLDRVTTYSYNTNGTSCNCGSGDKPHQINHPDGTITRYTYDKEWRLLTTVRAYIDSNNTEIITSTTSNTYDVAGQLFESTDTLGRVTRYEYDNDGRVTKITRAFGSTTTAPAITTYQYDLDGNRTQVANPVGTITTTTYDSMNRPRFITAALGTSAQAITEYIYTGPRLTSIKDPLLRATGMEYDALDRVVKTTLPDGNYTQSFFDLLGRNYASRDLRGNIPRSTFNSQGQTIASTDAAGVTTTAIYNGQGDLIRTSLPSSKAVAYTHDIVGNVIKTTIAPGTTEESTISEILTRDAMLRPLTVKDGEGKITTYTYDTDGRTTRIKNHLNQSTDYTYYADGQLHTTREADNLVTSTRTYDDLGRLKTDKDGKNQIIEYYYDAAGRMTSYKDAKGSTFGFGYDPLGRRTSRTEPNGTGQAYSYDVLGRLLTHTKADGTVLTNHYQNPHRDFLTKITQGSTTLRTYSYFVDGQLNTATNAHATISRSYDSAGRLIGETQSFTSGPSGGFSYDYDPDGNLEFHTRPDNTVVDYKYDLRNLLKKINTPVNATVAEYTYNGRNQPLQTKVENGLFIATRAYDHAGRLLSVTNGTLDSTSYDLTPDGRRETITRNSDTESYNYDNARQVSTANYGGLSTIQNWTYDEAGNRITAVNNGVTTNYGTAANAVDVNEYTSITGGGFLTPNPSYDPNGNTLHLPRPDGTALALGWNVHNELTSASNGAGDSAIYQYDAFGRRTRRTETIGGVTTNTWFFTNGWNVELEHNGTDPTQRMTWGLDLSGSLQGAGGVGGLIMVEDLTGSSVLAYYPTYDGNGNITAWVDGTGTVVARQRYDAFGNIIQQTGTAPSNYGFSTKPIEKVTGLLYYGYRYYDPLTGRWPSRDPIEENGGLNLYGFVGNNGVSFYDYLGFATLPMPDGWEDFCCELLLKLAEERRDNLKQRYSELLEDTKELYTKAYDTAVPGLPGTWTGHIKQFKDNQNILNKVLRKIHQKFCKLPPGSGIHEWLYKETPVKPRKYWQYRSFRLQTQSDYEFERNLYSQQMSTTALGVGGIVGIAGAGAATAATGIGAAASALGAAVTTATTAASVKITAAWAGISAAASEVAAAAAAATAAFAH